MHGGREYRPLDAAGKLTGRIITTRDLMVSHGDSRILVSAAAIDSGIRAAPMVSTVGQARGGRPSQLIQMASRLAPHAARRHRSCRQCARSRRALLRRSPALAQRTPHPASPRPRAPTRPAHRSIRACPRWSSDPAARAPNWRPPRLLAHAARSRTGSCLAGAFDGGVRSSVVNSADSRRRRAIGVLDAQSAPHSGVHAFARTPSIDRRRRWRRVWPGP